MPHQSTNHQSTNPPIFFLCRMKLLLAVSDLALINDALTHFSLQPAPVPGFDYLHTGKVLQHEVTFCETGHGSFQTGYKITKALSRERYHLALKISTGSAYKPDYAPGFALNIINEKPGDYGTQTEAGFLDLYDQQLLNREAAPHIRGGFVNLTNAYMNVFMPFKKAVGITVNQTANTAALTERSTKYKCDAETTDGLAFVYPCLYEKQSYYHLCFIAHNLVTGQADAALCQTTVNKVLIDLLNKI